MAITVSQYIEAVSNPNGRFRTLAGIYPAVDAKGELPMRVDELCVDFTMVTGGKCCTLKCFLKEGEKHRARLRDVATFTRHIDSPYLVPCSYLENELVVFDADEKPRYADVFLQNDPNGEPLGDFLARATSENDIGAIANLLRETARMARWLWENDFSAGRLSSYGIAVTRSLIPVVADYTRSCRKRSPDELRAWGGLLAAIYCCGAQPELYDTFIGEHITGTGKLTAFAATIGELLAEEPATPLSMLAEHIAGEPKEDGYTDRLLDLMANVASSEISESEALRKMSGFVNADGKTASPSRNLARYLSIGEMNCNLMKAFDGASWQYIDKNGNVAFDGRFLGASDFEEGRAVVETDTGYGLIDDEGRFVIEPVFDDISWDSYNNVAIVTKDGKSGLCSRNGDRVTGLDYEQILDCSEGLLPARKEFLYGYIGKDGKQAIGFIYDDAFGFRDGVARVRRKGRESLIDTEGKEIDTIL